MAAVLADFLGEAARHAWRWGTADCAAGFVADWVRLRTGIDPIAVYRGQYASEQEFRAIIRRCGGLLRIFTEAFAACGLAMTAVPKAGDVGLVRAPAKYGGRIVLIPSCGICLGEQWALRTGDRGLVVTSPPRINPIMVWAVP